MNRILNSILRVAGRCALCAGLAASVISVSSCVEVGPPPVQGRVVTVLPAHARRVTVHGERCWVHNGVFYRKHPGGYVIFLP
jgi:hypothetical protein